MPRFLQSKILRGFLLLTVVGVLSCALVLVVFARYLDKPLALSSPQVVTIAAGSSLHHVARDLADAGYLQWPRVFVAWVRWQGQDRAIRSGEYALLPALTPRGLLALLVSGRTVQYPVTLIEGWTVRQVLGALWQQDTINPTLQEMSDDEIRTLLQSPFPALEGSLFPDTYFHTRGTSDLAILQRASLRLQQVLQEEWAARAMGLPFETRWDALIMASIIERESGYVNEKRDIAGVFVRRLHTGMRLQSDPTVIYGMGHSYQGVIRRSDLNTTTPYNTYRINGLPPTPIAISGRDSIHASMQPREGTSLYFVSRGDGTHQFSDTLEQHNAAVRRYIKGENE